ncbi:hypothetical protein NA655_16470 [Pseudomonas kuykendallii]|uniref:Uncharacterized protein n=1 Tax=Pseudomonas kuykendallii TaxID=1007099 RepID=A0A1H2XQL5_9PSED|nr:hypothetical protein [Pseudomonas kuykendallii]MCQ4272624.1 hypothetical protein [Pseudomonas kuykendallii]SDW94978.1 hypothetical protein SAMN05216287_1989 [Pseudomonas kuykendallii]
MPAESNRFTVIPRPASSSPQRTPLPRRLRLLWATFAAALIGASSHALLPPPLQDSPSHQP